MSARVSVSVLLFLTGRPQSERCWHWGQGRDHRLRQARGDACEGASAIWPHPCIFSQIFRSEAALQGTQGSPAKHTEDRHALHPPLYCKVMQQWLQPWCAAESMLQVIMSM